MGLFKGSAFVLFVAVVAYVVINVYQLKYGDPSQKLAGYLAIKRIKFHLANVADFFGIAHLHDLLQRYETTGLWSASLEGSPVVEVNVTSYAGVRVIVYKPKCMEPASPSIVFYRGGLYLYGSPEATHSTLLELSERLCFPIIYVDYRRSLQDTFPAAFEDALNATKYYIDEEASKLGADPYRTALMGDDVGCSLVMAVALSMRGQYNYTRIKLQIMWNPILQALEFHTPAIQKHGTDNNFHKYQLTEGLLLYLLGEKSLVASSLLTKIMLNNDHVNAEQLSQITPRVDWQTLIPEYSESKRSFSKMSHPKNGNPFLASRFTDAVKDIRYSPLSAASEEDMKKLSPLYLITCRNDLAQDDGLLYKARLLRHQKLVYHKDYNENCTHHMFTYNALEQVSSVRAVNDLVRWFHSTGML